MAQAIKNITFFVILVLLVMPAVQNMTGLFEEEELEGDFQSPARPELSWQSWVSGTFQNKADPFIEHYLGLHNTLVRINNQVDFSLFGKPNAEGVVAGRAGILFERDYIRAYLGGDFMGRKFLDEKLRRLKFLQDYLLKEKDLRLILIFEPSKARMMPEFFPARFTYKTPDISNYEYAVRTANEIQVEFLDFNRYYLKLEADADYPLYPPYGIHWSLYGMTFCADSLISYVQSYFPFPVRKYDYTFDISDRPRRTDNDVEKTMNLLFPLPSPELAYPQYQFSENVPDAKPDVLVVGDSYYWNIYNTRIPAELFKEEAFWYFNSLVYPDQYTGERRVEELDLRKEIENRDFIFLMVTERFLYKFDWTFIDMVYDLYASEIMKYPEYEKINNITRNSPWFDSIVNQSIVLQKDLDTLLWEDAYYQYLTQDFADFMIQYGLERQMQIIREDTGWFAYIQDKAEKSGIGLEKTLRADADFMFQKKYPELHEIYHGVHEIMVNLDNFPALKILGDSIAMVYHQPVERFIHRLARYGYKMDRIQQIESAIINDSAWYEHVREKANQNGLPVDRMIHLDAIYVYEQDWQQIQEKYSGGE